MAAPAPEHVRNIVLVGQDGAGKTSLAEAMLFVSGKTPRMGTTHDGKSYLDYDPEEIKRKFTISTSIAPIPYLSLIHIYKRRRVFSEAVCLLFLRRSRTPRCRKDASGFVL